MKIVPSKRTDVVYSPIDWTIYNRMRAGRKFALQGVLRWYANPSRFEDSLFILKAHFKINKISFSWWEIGFLVCYCSRAANLEGRCSYVNQISFVIVTSFLKGADFDLVTNCRSTDTHTYSVNRTSVAHNYTWCS